MLPDKIGETPTIYFTAHMDIGENQVGFTACLHIPPSFVAGNRFHHSKVGITQYVGKQHSNKRFVFDHENRRRPQRTLVRLQFVCGAHTALVTRDSSQ
jgi:hypothetical protein